MTAPAADPVAIFRQEAQELLVQLEEALLDLEQSPDDGELVALAFRALHTIKGSGAMFGFEAAAAFTHHLENAFDRVRNGELPVTGKLVALALAGKDCIRAMIETPDDAPEAVRQAILADLAALVAAPPPNVAPSAAAGWISANKPSAEPVRWRIAFRPPPDALAMGANPLPLLRELAEMGDFAATADVSRTPTLDKLDPEACYLGWEATLITERSAADIEDVFLFVRDDCDLRIERVGGGASPAASAAESAAPTPAAPAPETPAPETPAPEKPAPDKTVKAAAPSAAKPNSAAVVKVQAERIDSLMDQVGELVIAQSRLKRLAEISKDSSLLAIAEEIERLSAGLRDTTMGVRMTPIGSLFGRFRRVVHDLSRDLGKDVRFVVSGEETELDKTVIESLSDPLVHLIRNALDHGVATPEERVAAGKPATGVLSLVARHEGAQVLISISDDGRGLDAARIRAKAEEKGLIAPGADLADVELFHLVFHPGFSTAAQVTSVSGRGVGMDVVKRTVESLRGSIDIASTPGEGTVFTLRLPLTLAIIDGLLVRVGEGRYIVPLSLVEECAELSEADEGSRSGGDFLDLRGELVPFLRLGRLFDVKRPRPPYQKIVIVNADGRRIGLVVDQLLGNHQTVIKSLSSLHADVEAFSGATILGDGGVALIVDVSRLVAVGRDRQAKARAA